MSRTPKKVAATNSEPQGSAHNEGDDCLTEENAGTECVDSATTAHAAAKEEDAVAKEESAAAKEEGAVVKVEGAATRFMWFR